MANWHFFDPQRRESLKFFSGLGNPQILAGYYDSDLQKMVDWLGDAAGISEVRGAMYATWQNKYDLLEQFAQEVGKFQK